MSLDIHVPWKSIFYIGTSIFLLVGLLGAWTLAGVLLLGVVIPLQGLLEAKEMGLQRAQVKQTSLG